MYDPDSDTSDDSGTSDKAFEACIAGKICCFAGYVMFGVALAFACAVFIFDVPVYTGGSRHSPAGPLATTSEIIFTLFILAAVGSVFLMIGKYLCRHCDTDS
ncbi:MAG: hypothetical protein E2598_10550 [Sphingobium sp.]|nr:hypothetical protein [Sphingobium sp.]